MRYALIRNNVVENLIEAEQAFINQLVTAGEIDEGVILAGEAVSIGDEYDGETFIKTQETVPDTTSELRKISLAELDEKLDLLLQMQLESEGIL